MAKKRSDEEEVQSRWHQFIKGVEVDPALQSFFQRHRGVGEEPRMLFEAVGEDLASSREDRRKQAFWILVGGMPELADILHERETRQPGWRSGVGQGQQVIDKGMDIVSHLYRKLVKEHDFKAKGGKDPRPYVRTAARNWKTDEWRKESRLVSLDEPLSDEGMTLGSSLAASLPDPTSVEDEVVNELYYEHGLQQIQTWNFLEEKELGWFAETYVAKRPFDSFAAQADIPAQKAAQERQRKSRARQRALKRLESIVGWYLTSLDWEGLLAFVEVGGRRIHPRGLPREAVKHLLDSWLWDWIQCAVRVGSWDEGVIVLERLVVRPLTHKFNGSAGHIFFITDGIAHRDYACKMISNYPGNPILRKWLEPNPTRGFSWSLGIGVTRFLKNEVPALCLPGLDQAINEMLKVDDIDIPDFFNIVCFGEEIIPPLQS
jgi:hypothetical protein